MRKNIRKKQGLFWVDWVLFFTFKNSFVMPYFLHLSENVSTQTLGFLM